MTDPYGDFFAREHLASTDFADAYGLDREVTLRISEFGTKDVRIFGEKDDRGQPLIAPKPVMFLVEHPRLPMFVSKTNHERLLQRFAKGYWLPHNRDDVLYAPVTMMAWSKPGRDGKMTIVEIKPGMGMEHRLRLGEAAGKRILDALTPAGYTHEKFRRFIQHNHRDLLGILDSSEGIADMPKLMAFVLDEFRRELVADLTVTSPPEPATPPASPPPPEPDPKQPWKDRKQPRDDNGFLPDEADAHRITPDDIPFF